MSDLSLLHLGRRERQIMEIVYQCGQASVTQVMAGDARSAELLDRSDHAPAARGERPPAHKEEGRKFVYIPVVTPGKARRFALKNVLSTFFDGSVEKAVASLIEIEKDKLSADDLDRLAKLIDEARKDGR